MIYMLGAMRYAGIIRAKTRLGESRCFSSLARDAAAARIEGALKHCTNARNSLGAVAQTYVLAKAVSCGAMAHLARKMFFNQYTGDGQT